MTKELYVPTVNRCPDNDLSFGVPQIVEAGMQAQRDPANLTDRQLEIIATYAYADAQIYARQRAEARAKAAMPPPVAPSRPAAAVVSKRPVARLPRLSDADDLSTPEGLAQWAEKNAVAAVPLLLWARVVNGGREKRECLAAEVRRLEGLLVLYEARIRTLEANTTTRGPRWAGEHEAGKSYGAGELVRRKGDVGLCVKETSAAPGMALIDWELFVKGGQARP